MRQEQALVAFNRGLVSPLGLARVDQKRLAFAAETMDNWMSRVLGSMSLRPGLGFLGAIYLNAAARFIPFVFATDDTALVEFTDSAMRIWIDDELLTRVSVSTSVTNGTFAGNITGWTDGSDVGGAISWEAGNYLKLTGTGTARAISYQAVTVSAGDQAKEHGLHIVINRGFVTLKVGTSLGDDSLIGEASLETGTHSLAFTPNTGTVYIQFSSSAAYKVRVQQCTVEAAGTVTIASPYLADDLDNIRGGLDSQSADVIFVACDGFQQRRIERRGTGRSWSIVLYRSPDGPFRTENVGPTTITPSALSGNITLTASVPLFKSTQVGALFRLVSSGQNVSSAISAQNTFTSAIQVTNVGEARRFTISTSGTGSNTVSLQRSLDSQATWQDVATYVADQSTTLADGLDNQIIFYRIGIKTGNYVGGTTTCSLAFSLGSLTGVARITEFSNSTSVSAEVLSALGATTATDIWAEGAWSDYRGWPTSVGFYEGRLGWAGKNGIWLSVSDAFDSFDDSIEGDSGPIARTIGSGPVDTINWLLPLQRLIVGAQGEEISARSSSLDEPLTPTNFNLKTASTQGSAAVMPHRIDQSGVYVQRGGVRVFEIGFNVQSYDYASNELTQFVPELGSNNGTAGVSIVRMAVQRQPDTRIHCIRSDGVAMVSVFDRTEEVLSWQTVTTDGLIEDVVILPSTAGLTEDQVYYVVKRTINGSTVRYLEKWAVETECRGGVLNKQADSFILYDGAATLTITVAHLEGEEVIVWADSVDLSPDDEDGNQTTYTVTSGVITLDTAVESAVVGLPYTGQWKSAKLGIQPSPVQSTLSGHKRGTHIGLVMANVHPKGLQYGPDFDNLDDLPEIEDGTNVPADTVRSSYEEEKIEFPGTWMVDARLCLQGKAPRPVTMMAAIMEMEIHG